jgi:hypothetical protein
MNSDGPTFRDKYCQAAGIDPVAFTEHLLLRSLYPHALVWVGWLRWWNRRHFDADYEFMTDVGYLRRHTDFPDVMKCYLTHPDNSSFLRRRLRMRSSVRRVAELVDQHLPREASSRAAASALGDGSPHPFPAQPSERSPERPELS